jgi:hypothetical protein
MDGCLNPLMRSAVTSPPGTAREWDSISPDVPGGVRFQPDGSLRDDALWRVGRRVQRRQCEPIRAGIDHQLDAANRTPIHDAGARQMDLYLAVLNHSATRRTAGKAWNGNGSLAVQMGLGKERKGRLLRVELADLASRKIVRCRLSETTMRIDGQPATRLVMRRRDPSFQLGVIITNGPPFL